MGADMHAGLRGAGVVITRPAGRGGSLATRVRRLGGRAVLLPGLSLRAVDDPGEARAALRAALQDDVLVFTSPAAATHAVRLLPLRPRGAVLAPGQGTARALRRAGVEHVAVPERHDSEGLLAHPLLADPDLRSAALVGAEGGRQLLAQRLAARGVRVREVHVYRRMAPRLDRRHVDAVLALRPPFVVLLSSAQALANLRRELPDAAWSHLCRGIAVCSSERLDSAARDAGFERRRRAASAHPHDLLGAAAQALA